MVGISAYGALDADIRGRGLSDTRVPPAVAQIQLKEMGEMMGVGWVSIGNGGTSPPCVTPCFSLVPPIPIPSWGDSPRARALYHLASAQPISPPPNAGVCAQCELWGRGAVRGRTAMHPPPGHPVARRMS